MLFVNSVAIAAVRATPARRSVAARARDVLVAEVSERQVADRPASAERLRLREQDGALGAGNARVDRVDAFEKAVAGQLRW